MSDITKVPMCRFCGQVNMNIDPDDYATAEAIEEAATRNCTCNQAKNYNALCEAADRAKEEVRNLLIYEAAAHGMTVINDPVVIRMLEIVCNYVADTQHQVIVEIPRGKVTVSPNGLKIKVQRTEKRSAESTVG